MENRKLRVLCFHSFRTSAAIFKEQMRRSGLDRKLEDIVEFTYLDAPHEATGAPPPDVAPFFDGPYREWWSMKEDPKTGVPVYEGGEQTMQYLDNVLKEQGPFDGLWAFSQGTILATFLLMLQRQGKFLHGKRELQFVVMFGGVFFKKSFESNALTADFIEDWKRGPLKVPSVHVIGDRDYVRKQSKELVEEFKDPIVISHPRGHNIPALSEDKFKELREFLEFFLPASMNAKKSSL